MTDELTDACKSNSTLQNIYLGTYAADEKPKDIKNTCCWIWNTDKKKDSGQHWVAFFKKGNKVTYFDSYGQSIRFYRRTSLWIHFIKKDLGCELVKSTFSQFITVTQSKTLKING